MLNAYYDESTLEDSNGKQYMLNAYYDESTLEDDFVFIIIINIEKNEEAYNFVLDWKSRNKDMQPIESRVTTIN